MALLAFILLCAPPSAAEPAFSGAVRDVLGNVLAEVEVLVIAPSPVAGEVRPVATVHTDAAGRFDIQQLASGPYQIAAIKRGYRTYIGQVDTQVDRWIQLVLHPQASAEAGGLPLPEDSSWALRLPRRNILREGEPAPPGLEPLAPAKPVFSELPVTLRVDQLFKMATDLPRVPGDDSVVQGTETHLNVGADLGRRGRVSIDGTLERLADSKFFEGDAPTARDRDRVGATVVYDTSANGRLSADFDYARTEARWEPRDGLAPAIDHEQGTWLGELAYEHQFGPATRLAVGADWAASEMTFPTADASAPPAGAARHGAAWNNRAFGGSARLMTMRGDGRRVELDVDVRNFDSSSPGLRATGPGLSAFDGVTGWSAGLRARETRDLSDKVSLIYGVGYRRALGGRDSGLLTSDLGARMSLRPFELKIVATHVDAQGERWNPEESMGYEAQLEVPCSETLSVSASHRVTPVIGHVGPDRPDYLTMIYVTDGDASLEQSRLALHHRTPTLQLVAALSQGTIDGTVAAVLPYDLGFQELDARDLGYRNGMVGLRFLEQGTLLTIDLTDVQESRQAMPNADSKHRSVALTLSQELPRREDLGRWRFLMGVSRDESSAGDPDDLRQIASAVRLDTTDTRLSAGLSLEF